MNLLHEAFRFLSPENLRSEQIRRLSDIASNESLHKLLLYIMREERSHIYTSDDGIIIEIRTGKERYQSGYQAKTAEIQIFNPFNQNYHSTIIRYSKAFPNIIDLFTCFTNNERTNRISDLYHYGISDFANKELNLSCIHVDGNNYYGNPNDKRAISHDEIKLITANSYNYVLYYLRNGMLPKFEVDQTSKKQLT